LGANIRPQLRRAIEQRYERVLALTAVGTHPPPVELYELGYGYYAVDGHRRIAAMKALGYDDITAIVIEYVLATDGDAQRLFAARQTFERATGLTKVGAASAAR
jgi:ParB-like chromosome segregation protein Spo0J